MCIRDSTSLTQHIINGFNQSPSHISILTAIDINKAFDTVPTHILIQKILHSLLKNNDKKWLSNFLTNRFAKVFYKNNLSHSIKSQNSAPQGAILSLHFYSTFSLQICPPQST